MDSFPIVYVVLDRYLHIFLHLFMWFMTSSVYENIKGPQKSAPESAAEDKI